MNTLALDRLVHAPYASASSWVLPATVLLEGPNGTYRVRLDAPGMDHVWADLAMAPGPGLKAGDRVLVTGQEPGSGWIIGRLDAPKEQKLETRSGASVAVTQVDGGERIEVRDADARLLVELDPATGRMQVSAPAGDLAFAAPHGDLELSAGGAVRVRGGKEVALETSGERGASFVLGSAVSRLSSRVFQLVAKKADLGVDDATYTGAGLRATLHEATLRVNRLETVAERLFERAKSVFRQVDDLHQLRAGRARTLVDEGYFLRTKHASIEAEDEVKIDGKQIQLG
jgi:hypothetical protein